MKLKITYHLRPTPRKEIELEASPSDPFQWVDWAKGLIERFAALPDEADPTLRCRQCHGSIPEGHLALRTEDGIFCSTGCNSAFLGHPPRPPDYPFPDTDEDDE